MNSAIVILVAGLAIVSGFVVAGYFLQGKLAKARKREIEYRRKVIELNRKPKPKPSEFLDEKIDD